MELPSPPGTGDAVNCGGDDLDFGYDDPAAGIEDPAGMDLDWGEEEEFTWYL